MPASAPVANAADVRVDEYEQSQPPSPTGGVKCCAWYTGIQVYRDGLLDAGEEVVDLGSATQKGRRKGSPPQLTDELCFFPEPPPFFMHACSWRAALAHPFVPSPWARRSDVAAKHASTAASSAAQGGGAVPAME